MRLTRQNRTDKFRSQREEVKKRVEMRVRFFLFVCIKISPRKRKTLRSFSCFGPNLFSHQLHMPSCNCFFYSESSRRCIATTRYTWTIYHIVKRVHVCFEKLQSFQGFFRPGNRENGKFGKWKSNSNAPIFRFLSCHPIQNVLYTRTRAFPP